MESIKAAKNDTHGTIARSNHTVMAPEDFDAFAEALDRPMNPTLRAFVEQKTVWEQR